MQTALNSSINPAQNALNSTLSSSTGAKYRVAQTIYMPSLESATIIYQNNPKKALNNSIVNNTISSLEQSTISSNNNRINNNNTSQYFLSSNPQSDPSMYDATNRNKIYPFMSQTLSRNLVPVKRNQSFQQNTTPILPRQFNNAAGHFTSTPMPGINSLYNPHHMQHNTINQGQHSHLNHHHHNIKLNYDDTLNKLINYYNQKQPFTPKSNYNISSLATISKGFPLNYKSKQQPVPPSIAYKPINSKLKSMIPNYDPAIYKGEPTNICVRFAVNGLSKYAKSSVNSTPAINRNLQAGDFGDDAGMIAENSKCIVIGLADGAGGNRSIGIDPQKFSRALMGYCVEIVKNEDVSSNHMTRLACKSVQTLESKNIEGSGTLCLLGLNKYNNMMFSMNIGDSGFRLIRNGSIVHKSKATMAGSSPKQLYLYPSRVEHFLTQREIADDSDLREFKVQKGDLILLSSDGLFDVLQDHVIEKLVNNRNERDLQGMADDLLVQTMRSYSLSQRDDILIMICRIESKDQFQQQQQQPELDETN